MITVAINTYNASSHLAKVLETVRAFDEILICDMESTDDTVEIARRYGARVVTFPKNGHTCAEPARNFAIQSAKHEWVFQLDADELVTPELRDYLYAFTANPGDVRGVSIPRRNFILNKFRSSFYPDYQLRFFMRDYVDWPPYVHSQPRVDGKVHFIPKNRKDLALIHIPPSIEGILNRTNAYTTAEVTKRKGKKVTLLNIMLEPFVRFIKGYFLKGGIRYGIAGFISSANDASYVYYRMAKLYEDSVRHEIAGGNFGELPEEVRQPRCEEIRKD